LIHISNMKANKYAATYDSISYSAGHHTDGLWWVNNLPMAVTWQWIGRKLNPWPRDHCVQHAIL